jgi:hypothetical protein
MRRMNSLQNFLNKILLMPQLRTLSLVISFLKLSDNVEYLKYKKDHTLDDSKVPLNKLKTAQGRLHLII